mmetsp:Transcript_11276/g.34567  ORF Transcript_11276/g.34567 Transcript_11276/m.34567 type:complete len:223 (+) Transcript_11276:1579-2247(+)
MLGGRVPAAAECRHLRRRRQRGSGGGGGGGGGSGGGRGRLKRLRSRRNDGQRQRVEAHIRRTCAQREQLAEGGKTGVAAQTGAASAGSSGSQQWLDVAEQGTGAILSFDTGRGGAERRGSVRSRTCKGEGVTTHVTQRVVAGRHLTKERTRRRRSRVCIEGVCSVGIGQHRRTKIQAIFIHHVEITHKVITAVCTHGRDKNNNKLGEERGWLLMVVCWWLGG